MELLKSSIFADCSTHRYAPIGPDCESGPSPIASRRPAFVINCTGLVLGAGLPGGAGGTAARIQLISRTRANKNADPFGTAHLPAWAGDPQTYALLHCSVFKERTLPPGPFWTGSLTAPKERGVRVNSG